ncbi:O-acetylserine/cysteine exporter [Pantoea wallisii]|uniref:O-acetylserine/cysteine exporter n=1 Tax=Pantoea wallisii TaxID=1076551 RepID=A0A1X1D759_9GAMM|nr:EamA family transporter [Pantoea wallisii]ORM72457.1 O-acetylserine/cysteine exporter [Pantoea wallisii]
MSLKDFALALVVIVAWGLNFVVSKISLEGVPPMLLGALRFALVVFPAIFFFRRPQIPWRWLIAYGLTISMGQFAFVFESIKQGMPAGLASVVLQAQAFFTLILASLLLKEKMTPAGLTGLLIAAGGLLLISVQGAHGAPLNAILLTLLGALCWALGNLITRRFRGVNPMALVIWGGLVPPVPFFALSWFIDGPDVIAASLQHITLTSVLSIIYLSFVATHLGFGLWSRLLAVYPAGKVAPLSLLVPVVGLSASVCLLDEHLSTSQWCGCALVMAGLVVNVFGSRLARAVRPQRASAR